MNRTLLITALAVLCTLLLMVGARPARGQAPGYRVIHHPGISVDRVTAEELSRIFLKKADRWEDGTRAFPVDQVETSPVREAFSRDVHDRSVAAIKSYWQQRIFSGRDVPPPEKASDRAVIEYVRATPGAVGYVSAGAALDGVEVLRVGE